MKTANYYFAPRRILRRLRSIRPGGILPTGALCVITRLALLLVAGLILRPQTACGQQADALEFNQSENLFGVINLLDGTFSALGSEGGTLFNDLAAAPNGTLYGIVNSASLVTLNPSDGAITSTVLFSTNGIESLAIGLNGTLYGTSQSALYTIDPTTGEVSLIGDFDNSLLNNAGQNIRFAADGNLYDTDGGAGDLNTDLFQINLATGLATTEGVITNFPGLCLENAGQIMYGVGIQINAASTLAQDLVGIDLNSLQPGGTNQDGSLSDIPYVLATTNFPNNYNFSSAADYTVPGTPVVTAPEPTATTSIAAGAFCWLIQYRRRKL